MSKNASDTHDAESPSGFDDGFDAVRSNAGFRGPFETHGHHEHTDHFAFIYDDRRQQFETVVPFVREGLEAGERCVYVADDNTADAVLDAMRARGVDVDGALESGALSVLTEAETYRQGGEFDQESMLEFWKETLADATDAEFTGLRSAAEMTWALDADETGLDELCQYEELLNPLYDGDDYTVLCQYNRDRFPTEVLHDVLRTHPYLVYDDATVCRNVYYTPPEEYFGPADPSRELDRKLSVLVDRTDARTTIEDRERYQRDLYETIADPEASFDEKLRDLLELGRERIGLEIGYFTETTDDETFEIVDAIGDHDRIQAGVTNSLRDSYCEKLLASPGTIGVRNATEAGLTDDLAYERYGLEAFFATTVHVGGDEYGTLCFASETPRERPFTDAERTFLDQMGQWLEYELDRRRRETFLKESYLITADPDLGFETKVEQLLELGRAWFDLEMGGLARVDPAADTFEVEATSGDHDELRPGAEVPLSETYCRATVDGESVAEVTDPERTGFGNTLAYEEFGVETYLGTRIELDNAPDRTFFFVSTKPRERPFTDAEWTFLDLMGQWITFELERKQREERLEESNERLEQFAYAASHDLQEPLRMVSTYLQLVEQRYADQLDDDGAEFLEYAVDGADRMREMIDGLLEYSRVETQGDPFEPVDLDDVLDDVLADLQLQIEESDAEIRAGSLSRVFGDASQLRQVLQNLLENAIQYSGDESPRVHLDAERRGREWVLSVHDDGIGIDPADQDRVFSVFDRLHSRDDYEGTGIGLALCQRIVERHGGDIWVDSGREGRRKASPPDCDGATFSFTLPAVDR